MSKLKVTYDGTQHCTALQSVTGKRVSSDACASAGGKGQELSPGELVAAGLASCMLFSMGVLALRDGLDISGTEVDVDVEIGEDRLHAIELTFEMPRQFMTSDRSKLEAAAGACPIKRSFLPEVRVAADFKYPKHATA